MRVAERSERKAARPGAASIARHNCTAWPSTGGAVSTTGIAGLTLGGGIGWLMGKYGLALDNLQSVELVTAEGQVLQASAEENPDLFWAVRGGGGNFGVVTSFEYRLFPVGPTVTGGLIAYPFDSAREMLRFYRDFTAAIPDEHSVAATLAHAPDGSGTKLAAMVACHCGPLAEGETAVQPIKRFGSPVMDALGPHAVLPAQQHAGRRLSQRCAELLEIELSRAVERRSHRHDDRVFRTIVRRRWDSCCSSTSTVRRLGSAPTDTAFPHRREGYNFLVVSQTMDPAIADRCTAWVRQTYAAMQPFVAPGRYVNYLDDDETGDAVPAAYGPNYRRLREIKTKYDPAISFT